MPAFRPLTRTASTFFAATFVDDAATSSTGKTVQIVKVDGLPTVATIDLVTLTPKPPTATDAGVPVREFVGVVNGVTFHIAIVGEGESGWLIVRRGLHGALYWSGTVFSGDAGEAIRFARSLDAERAIARLSLSDAEVLPVPQTRTSAAAPSWREG